MLPPEEQKKLLFLQANDTIQFKRRIASLKAKGWTVRDIAVVLDRAPSTIQYWSESLRLQDESDVPTPKPPRGAKVKTRYVEVPEDILQYLRNLAGRARRANRHSLEGTADYLMSKELTMMLGFLVKKRMVPVAYLARALDISSSAISQRIKEGTTNKWI